MRSTEAFDAFLINNSVHFYKQIYILGDWNYHFLGMKQIHGERWSRFSLHIASCNATTTLPQPRVYNMIREELALVKQNGAWKPRRKKGYLAFFTFQMGEFCWFNLIFWIAPSWSESNFILFLLFFRSELVRVDPSWSDPDWRFELIRSDFCTCLYWQGTVKAPFRKLFIL